MTDAADPYAPPPAAAPPAPPPGRPEFQQPQQPYSAQQYAQSPYLTPSYTGQHFASPLAQPTLATPPAAPVDTAPALGLPLLPAPATKGRTVSIWMFGVLGFLLIGLVAYFLTAIGPVASAVGLVLALIPLAIVFVGVRMIDRWEPEPQRLVIFAVAWGAIAAVGLTLLVDLGLTWLFGRTSDAFGAVVQAPIIEEVLKGLGIVLVYLMARRAFNGPVDGVVYGALIGAGFAFTENVQYFAISLIEGGGANLTFTFFLRGLMSPFAHAMFTALTGFAIGLAARRHSSTSSVLAAGGVGLISAILLHGFWNWSATFADFVQIYFTMQVPLFMGFILAIVALRREEARVTRERLGDYVAAGWFTPEEVTMLATPAGRKAALAWAATLRGDRRPLMRSFIKDATELAAVRQRAITGRDPLAADDERALLIRTRATKSELLAF